MKKLEVENRKYKVGLAALAVIGLMLGSIAGCMGGEKHEDKPETVEEKESVVPENQTEAPEIPEQPEEEGPRCPDDAMKDPAQPPTDKDKTMAHWHFDCQANGYFQYWPVPALPVFEHQFFTYKLDIKEDIMAVECHVDWESPNMDLDLYFKFGDKVVWGDKKGDNHPMMNDPLVLLIDPEGGSTWEYFNVTYGESKRDIREPGEYVIEVEVFNNWEPDALSGGTTPFTVDIWVYTEIPSSWHSHQKNGE